MRELIKQSLCRHFSAEIEIQESFLGGNSIVHHVKVGDLDLAVKEYKGDGQRKLTSFKREEQAFYFLNKHAIHSVPKILYSQENLGFIVTEFISGDRPKPNRQSIEALLVFVEQLHEVFQEDSTFPCAIDAGIRLREIQNQIIERVPEVKTEFKRFLPRIENLYKRIDIRRHEGSSQNKLTYSVSDLGLHNSLMLQDRLYYFDLEFFGKDSPYKLIGDFLLHPQNLFSEMDNAYFLDKSITIFDLDVDEIKDFMGLLAVKWSLICIKRLQNLNAESVDPNVLQAQNELVGYYLNVAELFEQSDEWFQLLNKERFSK